MTLEANRTTTLHIAKAEDREFIATTLVTANALYLSLAFDVDNNILWFGSHTSPEEMDIMRVIKPATVFAAATPDIREVANYLTMVADALEANEHDVAKACDQLFKPQEEEPVEEEPVEESRPKPSSPGKRSRKKKGGDE